jgi:hypothetical protein
MSCGGGGFTLYCSPKTLPSPSKNQKLESFFSTVDWKPKFYKQKQLKKTFQFCFDSGAIFCEVVLKKKVDNQKKRKRITWEFWQKQSFYIYYQPFASKPKQKLCKWIRHLHGSCKSHFGNQKNRFPPSLRKKMRTDIMLYTRGRILFHFPVGKKKRWTNIKNKKHLPHWRLMLETKLDNLVHTCTSQERKNKFLFWRNSFGPTRILKAKTKSPQYD